MTQDPSFVNLHLPYANATVEDLSQCFVTTGEPAVMSATGIITNRITLVEQADAQVTATLPATAPVGSTYTVGTLRANENAVILSSGVLTFYLTNTSQVFLSAGMSLTVVRVTGGWLHLAESNPWLGA